MFGKQNDKRSREKERYARTVRARNYMPGTEKTISSSGKRQTGPTPKWHYLLPTWLGSFGFTLLIIFAVKYAAYVFATMPYTIKNKPVPPTITFWHSYHIDGFLFLFFIIVTPIIWGWLYKKLHAVWFNNNAMFLTDDMVDHEDDAYVRGIDNLTQELDVAPDAGLGYDGHVSSIMGHMMVSNKGINKVNMPVFDPNVDGYVKRDENGQIVRKLVPMFDPEFANMLFSMSAVPQEYRIFYDARDYDFNRKLTKSEGGGKDKNGHYKRAGAYGRKEYDKLSDYINSEFYPLDTDTQRPAGVYFYDSRPVNTILIAITRAGKGQTYIEASLDLWSREKHPWNMFNTDPKGELLAKFYYPLTVRGFEIVQFNLMHTELTSVFNPLANALQEFRQNNDTKGTSLIDSIVDTLFPDDNGEIWNPAAGNMFRRAVYLLFDYYLEQENYIRYLGHKNGTPQEVIDQEIDKNYSKVTLFNVYSLIGDLAAKVSTDVDLINVNPDDPPTNKKDFLTLIFDAMACLPPNTLRQKAITANNSIKQIASAEQTIAGIYATLLTGLSVYADPTAIALMSGSPNESFDVTGLGFPRRVGVQIDKDYVKKFRITGELYHWSIYRDVNFTDKYEGSDFEHEGRVEPTNWVWGFFKGILEDDVAYMRLDIEASGMIAKTFYFKFVRGYRTYDSITYVTNPITHKKEVHGGTLIEIQKGSDAPYTSEFTSKRLDILQDSYHAVTSPVLVANQVFYSEQPKAVFAVTPPHLQVYQKHILVIIKQILDGQYSSSYVVKKNRKPIVGLRLMLDEFGNIRSGKNGIPGIDTAASIGLGQDIQFTFVLQSFQQLRSVYGEDIEKILRANSSNTIFLKSNDKELIDELVRMSGVKHQMTQKGKSVSRKMGDMITVSEPVINYSMDDTETTALTQNDLLFLAGQSPGNAITFSSGEMPIVCKNATILPMAAGLHKHLPEPKEGQYSDSTMPARQTDTINYLDNLIDGDALVRARVAQAKIWLNEVKPKVEALAKKEDVVINERDGSLSTLVMNTVYEMYDKQEGRTRSELANRTPYWEQAKRLVQLAAGLSDTSLEKTERLSYVSQLKEELIRLTMNHDLDDLTAIYRNTKPSDDVDLGYDPSAITRFIRRFRWAYPEPPKMQYETQDINAMANKDPNYKPYTGNEEKDFDFNSQDDYNALNNYFQAVVLGDEDPAKGIEVKHNKGSKKYRIWMNGKNLWMCETAEPDAKDKTIVNTAFAEGYNDLSDMIAENADLMARIQNFLNDEDN